MIRNKAQVGDARHLYWVLACLKLQAEGVGESLDSVVKFFVIELGYVVDQEGYGSGTTFCRSCPIVPVVHSRLRCGLHPARPQLLSPSYCQI